jgi:hypothetical protein
VARVRNPAPSPAPMYHSTDKLLGPSAWPSQPVELVADSPVLLGHLAL